MRLKRKFYPNVQANQQSTLTITSFQFVRKKPEPGTQPAALMVLSDDNPLQRDIHFLSLTSQLVLPLYHDKLNESLIMHKTYFFCFFSFLTQAHFVCSIAQVGRYIYYIVQYKRLFLLRSHFSHFLRSHGSKKWPERKKSLKQKISFFMPVNHAKKFLKFVQTQALFSQLFA